MGCGYSRGQSSGYQGQSQPINTIDLFTIGFFATFCIFFFCVMTGIMTGLLNLLFSPLKTKITDYYSVIKIDSKSAKGPYKHVED